MKRSLLVCWAAVFSLSIAHAGSEIVSKESVAPAPCPTWYADSEWNLSLWGTYAFTANDYPTFENSILSPGLIFLGPDPSAKYDKYLEADHAWGGGFDVKYFFKRYFGLGIEGFAVSATRSTGSATILPPPPGTVGSGIRIDHRQDERAIGAVLAEGRG